MQSTTSPRTGTPQTIMALEDIISEVSGVSIQDIRGRQRDKEYADARHAVWYVANVHMKYSLKYLSRIYHRDHTTILSGVKKMVDNEFGEVLIQSLKNNYPDIFNGNYSKTKSPENWKI